MAAGGGDVVAGAVAGGVGSDAGAGGARPEEPLRLRNEDLAWRQAGDEVVILNAATGLYLTLNQTARGLWDQLAAGTTPAALAQTLVDRHGVDRAQALADVARFLDSLDRLGILEPATETPGS